MRKLSVQLLSFPSSLNTFFPERVKPVSFLYATHVALVASTRATRRVHPLTDAPLQMNLRTVDFSFFILIFNSRFLPLILRHVRFFPFFFPFLSFLFFSFSFHPRSFPQPDTVLNYVSFCNDHVPFLFSYITWACSFANCTSVSPSV